MKDGKMKELAPDPELAWKNKAFWLRHALDKDFDPGEYRDGLPRDPVRKE